MFTLRVTQTWHAGRNCCQVCVYATGGFTFTWLFHILECMFPRKNWSSGPMGWIMSFAQLASVLHVLLSCEGTVASTTTSIQVMSSSKISPSSWTSNVHSLYVYLCSMSRSDTKSGRCTAINGVFKGRLDTWCTRVRVWVKSWRLSWPETGPKAIGASALWGQAGCWTAELELTAVEWCSASRTKCMLVEVLLAACEWEWWVGATRKRSQAMASDWLWSTEGARVAKAREVSHLASHA